MDKKKTRKIAIRKNLKKKNKNKKKQKKAEKQQTHIHKKQKGGNKWTINILKNNNELTDVRILLTYLTMIAWNAYNKDTCNNFFILSIIIFGVVTITTILATLIAYFEPICREKYGKKPPTPEEEANPWPF